jgi:hypothetical protein
MANSQDDEERRWRSKLLTIMSLIQDLDLKHIHEAALSNRWILTDRLTNLFLLCN